ncbi:variant erythrocyte surface antigen-1 family protein, partial [Babesia divergens]
TRRDLSITV